MICRYVCVLLLTCTIVADPKRIQQRDRFLLSNSSTNKNSSIDKFNARTCGGSPDDATDKNLWVFAILASLVCSTGATFGTIMQKIAQRHQLSLPPSQRAPVCFSLIISWRWMLGLFLLVIMPVPFDLVSYSLAPQSLIAPLAGVTLIFTVIVGPCMLGETISRRELLVCGVICIGVTLTTVFGPKDEPEIDMELLIYLWSRTNMIAMEAVVWPIIGLCFAVVKLDPEKLRTWRPLFLSFLAGAFGGQQNIFFKGVGILIRCSIEGTSSPFTSSWLSYVWIVMAGLALFDAVLFLPLYTVMFLLSSTIFGSVYYDEFICFGAAAWTLFPLGVVITIVACCVLPMMHDDVTSAKAAMERLNDGQDVDSFYEEVASPRGSARGSGAYKLFDGNNIQ